MIRSRHALTHASLVPALQDGREVTEPTRAASRAALLRALLLYTYRPTSTIAKISRRNVGHQGEFRERLAAAAAPISEELHGVVVRVMVMVEDTGPAQVKARTLWVAVNALGLPPQTVRLETL